MIFFNVPSVGQIKPETLFGEDDHYGFIQTLIGEEYRRADVSSKCMDYYQTLNDGYWDRIITIANFLGLKRLDAFNRFLNIPLLDAIAEKYDEGNNYPAQLLFDYLLCQWQYPHPIVTKNTEIKVLDIVSENPRKNFPIIKPYNLILRILINLYNTDPKSAYFSKEEFYWFTYSFYKSNGLGYESGHISKICKDLLDVRTKGWDLFEDIANADKTKTHLSYPLGFLRNSSVLTNSSEFYDIQQSFFFIGLKDESEIASKVNLLIENSESIFEFDRQKRNGDIEQNMKFSEYLYNSQRFDLWVNSVKTFALDKTLIAGLNQEEEIPADIHEMERIRAEIQMKRLADLDKVSVSRRRTEQYILRHFLLKNKEFGNCGICNHELPVSFLATAHIKKRSACNNDEKRDLAVVIPACYLGCDKLFEDGYLVVKEGKIVSNYDSKPITPVLKQYVDNLDGEICIVVNESNIKYFEFHMSSNQ